MKPEEQRIAIAQACGWTDIGFTYFGSTGLDPLDGLRGFLPNYLNDLNAMHEAEKALDPTRQQEDYWDFIFSITGSGFEMCHATASQKAEAFLRTLDLWTE
jgi:hypothetical protein